jgi:hypothetical protein
MEIVAVLERERKLNKQLQQTVIKEELRSNGYNVSGHQLRRTHQAVQIMDKTIMNGKLSDSQRALWDIQCDKLNEVHTYSDTDRKRAKAKVYPVLMSWSIPFLTSTLISVYKEVQNVMKLPNICHVQRETANMVLRNADKAIVTCVGVVPVSQS